MPGVARQAINVEMPREEWERRMQPKHDWVLLRMSNTRRTDAGLELPTPVHARPWDADVVKVGPGIFRDGTFCEPCVKAGDKVMLNPMNHNIFPVTIRTTDRPRNEWTYVWISERVVMSGWDDG